MSEWFEHRRGDGERLGWIVLSDAEGESFCAVDLLGRRSAAGEWTEAEDHLEELGLGYLTEIYAFQHPERGWLRARIVEVSPEAVVIKEDDFGDATRATPTHRLPFPAPETLMPLRDAEAAGIEVPLR